MVQAFNEKSKKNGVIHDGKISTKLGLVPIPYLAETVAVSTLLLLQRIQKVVFI